jgi:hypothetical protein
MSKARRADEIWYRRWLNRLLRWGAISKSKREDDPKWFSFPLGWRELTEEETKYTMYKWKFLRRNEKYKAEWEQMITDVKSKYGESEADFVASQLPREYAYKYESFSQRILPEERTFCERWGIAMALCPDRSYEGYIAYEGNDTAHYFMYRSLIPQSNVPVRHRMWFEEDLEQFMENGTFIVEVNINYPKKRLKEQFSLIVDNFKEFRERNILNNMMLEYCRERNLHPTLDPDELDKDEWREFRELYSQEEKKRKAKYSRGTSLYYDNFDTYLKVWDLKKEDKSYSEIADALELNSKDTAINHYKAAKRLIKEGIELYGK